MLKRGIQLASSTYCIALVAELKFVHKGMVIRKLSTAPANASMRASGAFRSPPVASTAKPERIGIQMERLSKG